MPPAARITDMHTCPMSNGPVPHVGGPIVKGQPNVIVCGMPQARVSDQCVCVGPPDVIVKGSATVMVGGLPAARLGDQTAHGGVIVTGAPVVMIGDSAGGGGGGGGKSGQAKAAKKVDAPKPGAVAEKAGGSGKAAPPKNPVASVRSSFVSNAAKPICLELAEAADKAALADHVYGEGGAPPAGYTEVAEEELLDLGLSPKDLAPEESTFRAKVYKQDTPKGPAYTLAFRGTSELADWKENFLQGMGLESAHYDRAKTLARMLHQQVDHLSFTGHSLGGGLASAAAVATGSPAHTFNAAGLHANTVIDPETAGPGAVKAYYVPGEVLSKVQDNRSIVVGGAVVAADMAHPALGLFIAGWAATQEAKGAPPLPQAFGERKRLPIAGPPDPEKPDTDKEVYDGVNPIKRFMHSVDRHGMDWVQSSINKQRMKNGCL